jgi:hypothetical protein
MIWGSKISPLGYYVPDLDKKGIPIAFEPE